MRKAENVCHVSNMARLRMEASVGFLIGMLYEKGRKRRSRFYHGRPEDGGCRGLSHRAAQ